ncbi:Alpha/beta hydrolase fold-1 [Mycena venus]|uniref:Alpha/beta hydrolase fold-1 n=1 Tax=Mycena venus TaxID=2733690 RepID=A0A8H7DEP7_9AGAR|nr:Alpha/beta hydrolase fold-1 [Mycena venus]
MLLFALSLLSHLYVAYGASCRCSSVTIPVHVDVQVPKDPTDMYGGLTSNASSLRHLDATYNVYGVFCQPVTLPPKNAGVIQLLVHGFSYDSQYWSPPVEEFRNYSYAAYSCDRGLSSLAIDWVGVGLSSRPANSSDVQFASCAAAVSQVARRLKSESILTGVPPFKKVVGIGHSAGSGLLNFNAITEGAQSPFDGLILTGELIVQPGELPPSALVPPGAGCRPAPLGIRAIFYPPDPTSFSPRMLMFDEFTKDVGTVGTFYQIFTNSLTSQYNGSVAKVIGSEDQIFCVGTGRCANVTALTAAERVPWPAVKSFELAVAQGSGHSMNLDFFANGPFSTCVHFVKQFTGLPY